MSARARVKQTAVATSAYAFTLDGGVADGDLPALLFRDAFQVPSVATVAGTVIWYDVPVLIEVTSGTEAGKWQVCTGTLSRSGTDVLTFTTSATKIAGVSTQTGDAVLTPLTIASGDTATLSVVPPGYELISLRGRAPLTDIKAGADSIGSSFSGAEHTIRLSSALLALGAGALAYGDASIAIGDGASTPYGTTAGVGACAIGYQAIAGPPFSASLGGHKSFSNGPYEVCIGGMSDIQMLQSGTTPSELWLTHSVGIKAVSTTDATPTNMQAYNPVGWVSGDTAAIASSHKIYCDSGITRVTGRLTAINPATGDMKCWDLEWTVKTTLDYATTSLFVTLSKTVVANDTGAASWDCDVTTDSATNTCAVQVTGAAATEIVWSLAYDAHYSTVYI